MSARNKIAALKDKLAAFTLSINEQIAELEVEASTEVNTDLAQAGASVTFNYGRKDTAKSFTGVVLGRKADDKNRVTVKVQVGSGFDAEIFSIYTNAITAVSPVQVVDADPVA